MGVIGSDFRNIPASEAALGPPMPTRNIGQFANGILHLFQPVPDEEGDKSSLPHLPLLENLQRTLIEKLEDAVLSTAAELRAEIPGWLEAIDQLKKLSASRYFPRSQLAEDLRRDLELNAAHAPRLVESLENLPADRQRMASESLSDKSAHVLDLPDPRRLESARACKNRADAYRRHGDYQKALAAYTEAIKHDCRFVQAFIKRGQTWQLIGIHKEAVEDFTIGLQLEPVNTEAFFRRGDSFSQLSQFARAVQDYTKALHLNPSLLLARHNRALVYRLAGDHPRAIAELTEILQKDSSFAPAYFNRGAIFLAGGEHAQALDDFTKALEFNPNDQDASAKLAEARQLLESAPERLDQAERGTVGAGADAAPASVAAATMRSLPAPPIYAIEEQKAQSESNEATSKKESNGDNLLRVSCPDCGASGEIPWDRLGRILICKACSQHYRIRKSGEIVSICQNASGKWIETSKHKPARRRYLNRWSMSAAVAAVLAVGYVCFMPKAGDASSVPKLPNELEPRVELLTKAWLNKDVPMMRQLTLSTYERGIYSWLLRHPPPIVQKPTSAELDNLLVKMHQRRKSEHSAEVVANVQGIPTTARGKTIELAQFWEEREGTWYFIPPSR